MLKAIVLVGALAAPALADIPTYHLDIALKSEHFTLFIADGTCGEIELKAPARSRFFRVCVESYDNKLKVEVERRTRDAQDEMHSKTTVSMAVGASFDFGDLKLSLK